MGEKHGGTGADAGAGGHEAVESADRFSSAGGPGAGLAGGAGQALRHEPHQHHPVCGPYAGTGPAAGDAGPGKEGGRTATLLRLEESALYSVGISLDSTYIHVALLNFRKKLVGERAEKNPFAAPTLEQALGVAHRLYTGLLQETGVPPAQVCGVGVTMPGVMQGSEILAFTPQLQWKGLNVRRAVQQRFGTENVRVENDCNAALLGQCVLDPELRKQDAAFLCIGSGDRKSVV